MKDKLLALAKECGAFLNATQELRRDLSLGPPRAQWEFKEPQLAAFAARIRAEALEEAAKMAQDWPAPIEGRIPLEIARAIRALAGEPKP